LRNKVANISWWAVKRWYITLSVIGVLLIGGLISYTKLLPREGFPPVQFPLTIVQINSIGADSDTLDKTVAKPFNDKLVDKSDTKKVTTTSVDNFFSGLVYFNEGVDPATGTEKVKQVIKDIGLPKTTQTTFITVDPAKYQNKYDALVSVYATNGQNVTKLQSKAEKLAIDISDESGIESANVEKLTAVAIDPNTGKPNQQQVYFNQTGVKEYEKLRFYPSITIGITKTEDVDAIELSDSINNWINNNQQALESDNYRVMIGADFAETIENDISNLQENLIGGIVAVIIVTFLLISLRSSLIIAGFMICVLLITMLIFYLIGYSLNVITLFGLVLTLALFVDDATIVVEALDAQSRKTRNLRLAIKTASRKVAVASFAGTLSTILVFVPLIFISGVLGDFIRFMPITVIISLALSYVLSITLVPVLAKFTVFRQSTKKQNSFNLSGLETRISGFLSSRIIWLRTDHKKGVMWASAMVGLSVGLIVTGILLSKELTFNIFPPSKDSSQLQLNIDYPPNTNLIDAEQVATDLNEVLSLTEAGNIERVIYGGSNQASNRSADLVIQLTPIDNRNKENTSVKIAERLQPKLTQIAKNRAEVRLVQLDAGPPPEQFPFKVQIIGENANQSTKLVSDIQSFLTGREIEKQNGESATIIDTNLDYIDGTTRIDGRRTVQVEAAFNDSDTSALVSATESLMREEFNEQKLKTYGFSVDDVTYDAGQESENAKSFESLGVVFPIALLLIFILLMIQFKSILQPLLIFLALPFSIFGVVSALLLTNNALSFFSMVGLIGLVGIAVNNSIMLTDYANQARKETSNLADAVALAVNGRVRPLIATTLTAVVALLPLALFDPFWQPLAVVIIGGLLSSTFLVIVAFPFYYYALAVIVDKYQRRRKSLP